MESGATHFAGTVVLLMLLTGCAYSYVGADGSRHVVGLAHVILPPEGPHPSPAASIRTQALGFSLTQGDVGTALSLGYSDITIAYVRENTCVRWPLDSVTPVSLERRSR